MPHPAGDGREPNALPRGPPPGNAPPPRCSSPRTSRPAEQGTTSRALPWAGRRRIRAATLTGRRGCAVPLTHAGGAGRGRRGPPRGGLALDDVVNGRGLRLAGVGF